MAHKTIMTQLRNLRIFPLKNDEEFENLCLAIWKRILNDPNTQLNGRRDQRQKGVDLFGRRNETFEWVGVQCKVRTDGPLTKDDILNDVEKARSFNPRLSELVFATTAPRDQTIQEFAREVTESNKDNNEFSIAVYSWDDIQLELSEEYNIDIFRKFYKDFFIDYENLGIAISRILRISIGVESRTDTSYEILIGKTPTPPQGDAYFGLDYWRGVYFIANWNSRAIVTFPIPTYPSDLDGVFVTKRDSYIISRWLTELSSVDEIIYGDSDEYIKIISKEEYMNFLKTIRE